MWPRIWEGWKNSGTWAMASQELPHLRLLWRNCRQEGRVWYKSLTLAHPVSYWPYHILGDSAFDLSNIIVALALVDHINFLYFLIIPLDN